MGLKLNLNPCHHHRDPIPVRQWQFFKKTWGLSLFSTWAQAQLPIAIVWATLGANSSSMKTTTRLNTQKKNKKQNSNLGFSSKMDLNPSLGSCHHHRAPIKVQWWCVIKKKTPSLGFCSFHQVIIDINNSLAKVIAKANQKKKKNLSLGLGPQMDPSPSSSSSCYWRAPIRVQQRHFFKKPQVWAWVHFGPKPKLEILQLSLCYS
jgi:hypothetical protein